MTAAHGSMVWPFLALLPILLLRPFCQSRSVVTIAVCCAVAYSGYCGMRGVRYAIRETERHRTVPGSAAFLQHSRAIVVGEAARGWFPRWFWFFPDDIPVFAANVGYLLDHKDEWLDHIGPGTVYVDMRTRMSINKLLAQRGRVQQVRRSIGGVGRTYVLVPRNDE